MTNQSGVTFFDVDFIMHQTTEVAGLAVFILRRFVYFYTDDHTVIVWYRKGCIQQTYGSNIPAFLLDIQISLGLITVD